MNRNDALAAAGRGANEELGLPEAGNRVRLKNRCGGLKLDQDDNGGGYGDGRCRVHHDAERAMVGVAIDGMDVRHLNDGQQRQQNKTHHRECRKSPRFGAALCSEM